MIATSPTERDRWFECTRKKAIFATRAKAERVAENITKEDRAEKREARPWNAYHCRFCGSYHIGHERKVEPCGICDVPHKCHCPRLKSWCDECPALGADR